LITQGRDGSPGRCHRSGWRVTARLASCQAGQLPWLSLPGLHGADDR
jgi:hypothetical protein